MTSLVAKISMPNAWVALLVVTGMAGSFFPPLSQAQQVYRSVGPDGKVTFSDQPPAAGNTKVSATNASPAGGEASVALPFELRQIAAKYPVTLYTGDNCAPCGAGRSLLTSRGIPFTEKTVTTNEDVQTLQRLSGNTSLPFMTIGAQQLKGFSDTEWTQYLNAAGYPASSVLPTSYRRPAAAPLVAVASATAARPAPGASAPSEAETVEAPVTPTATPADNPAGIKF